MLHLIDYPGISKAYVETEIQRDGTMTQTLVVETGLAVSNLDSGWNEEAFNSLVEAIVEAMKKTLVNSARIKKS